MELLLLPDLPLTYLLLKEAGQLWRQETLTGILFKMDESPWPLSPFQGGKCPVKKHF